MPHAPVGHRFGEPAVDAAVDGVQPKEGSTGAQAVESALALHVAHDKDLTDEQKEGYGHAIEMAGQLNALKGTQGSERTEQIGKIGNTIGAATGSDAGGLGLASSMLSKTQSPGEKKHINTRFGAAAKEKETVIDPSASIRRKTQVVVKLLGGVDWDVVGFYGTEEQRMASAIQDRLEKAEEKRKKREAKLEGAEVGVTDAAEDNEELDKPIKLDEVDIEFFYARCVVGNEKFKSEKFKARMEILSYAFFYCLGLHLTR
jgi:hypothetical protein